VIFRREFAEGTLRRREFVDDTVRDIQKRVPDRTSHSPCILCLSLSHEILQICNI